MKLTKKDLRLLAEKICDLPYNCRTCIGKPGRDKNCLFLECDVCKTLSYLNEHELLQKEEESTK